MSPLPMPGRVSEWLEQLELGAHVQAFEDNEIGWDVLPSLDHELLKELGVTAIGHRIRLLNAIAALAEAPAVQVGVENGVEPPQSSGEAERRQLTVMFCDLADSTALSTRLDPEDLREVNRAYQDACTAVIERYDGFVARYMGDGVLAYFGYPRAHEDDAERAVRAGLGIVAAISDLNGSVGASQNVELAVRVGIATGPVVVGDLIGEGASQESAVVGETPNLASRLQGVAERNRVVIGETTRRLASGGFEYRDLGQQALKGIDGRVSAWLVHRELEQDSRFEAAHSHEIAPLVGREEQRGMLFRRWQLATEGAGQVVLLSGEAGIGKSRLVKGLREQLVGESYTSLNYQCSPYHGSSALYPVLRQLERAAGFDSDDDAGARLDKLERMIALSSDSVEPTSALLAALFSLPGDERYGALDLTPAQRKDRTLAALVEQLRGLATREPVLMVLEDMHWIDPTTLELCDLLVESISSLRVLAIFTFRPEFTSSWIGEANVTSIALNKLGPDTCKTLVDSVTGGRHLPATVLREIVEKTDGVPLFVEELTKTVIESGMLREEAGQYALDQALPPLAIPATLQDSLTARLDRLASVKDIAQIGAVIGREFSHGLLAAVTGLDAGTLEAGLDKLSQAGLVFRRGTPPDASYVFKHALIQDSAYASLLKSRLQQVHAKIATVLESRFPDLVSMQPELAAHHLERAGLTERAIEYWRKAATLAASRSSLQEAYDHLGAALVAHEALPETHENLRLRLDILVERITPIIAAKGYSSPELTRLHGDAMTLCNAIGVDAQKIFPIVYALWVHDYTSGRVIDAIRIAGDFVVTAQEQNARLPLILGRRIHGSTSVMNGDARNGVETLERVTEELDDSLADEIGLGFGQDMLVAAHCYLAYGCAALGEIERAYQHIDAATGRAARLGHALTRAYAYGHLGLLLVELGDTEGADRTLKAMEEVLAEHPMPIWNATLGYVRGPLTVHEGNHSAGEAMIRETMAKAETFGFALWRPLVLAYSARAQIGQGKLVAAQETVSKGLAEIEQGCEGWALPELYRIRAVILERQGGAGEDIDASYAAAIDSARAQPNRIYELRAALGLARRLATGDRQEEAKELLVGAIANDGLNLPDGKEAQKLLDQLS